MKRGRTPWYVRLSPGLKRRLDSLIDARELSAREIHDRLNLSRFTCRSTMAHYCSSRRREREHRREEGSGFRVQGSGNPQSPIPNPQSPVDEVIGLYVEAAREAVLAGRVGKVNLSRVLGALKGLKEVKLQALAEERAAELHRQKMKQIGEKLETVAVAQELTPEQVAEIRLKVLGL